MPLLEDVSELALSSAEPTGLNKADQHSPTIAFLSSLARSLDAHVFSGAPVKLQPTESRMDKTIPGQAIYAHNIGDRYVHYASTVEP